jgi:hypothetical protein
MSAKCSWWKIVLVWLSAAPVIAQSAVVTDAVAAGRLSTASPTCRRVWAAVLRGVFSLTNPMTGATTSRSGRQPPIRRPSRIVDPADGKVPYQPWAAALQERQSGVGARHPAVEIDTQSRCLLDRAAPPVDAADAVSHPQAPGLVLFAWEDFTRLPHRPPTAGRSASGVALWMGDRGHWEGNPVIDTTNLNGKGRPSVVGDFSAHARDRAPIFTGADAMTMRSPSNPIWYYGRDDARRREAGMDYEFWENACHGAR